VIEKESLKFKELEHVRIEKVEQLFRDMLCWGREIAALGHDVRLMPPQFVKPYVKSRKNDAADAERFLFDHVIPRDREAL
jgi:transposase